MPAVCQRRSGVRMASAFERISDVVRQWVRPVHGRDGQAASLRWTFVEFLEDVSKSTSLMAVNVAAGSAYNDCLGLTARRNGIAAKAVCLADATCFGRAAPTEPLGVGKVAMCGPSAFSVGLASASSGAHDQVRTEVLVLRLNDVDDFELLARGPTECLACGERQA
jgi:hypothetical protein